MQTPPDTEQLLCALMFLLTRQVRSPEMTLAPHIRDHLGWLADHPDTASQPMLRNTCRRLLVHWQRETVDAGATVEGEPVRRACSLH